MENVKKSRFSKITRFLRVKRKNGTNKKVIKLRYVYIYRISET